MPFDIAAHSSGDNDFSFSAFARQPFYQQENAHLVDLIGLKPGQKVVDLACGPGSVTKLILEKVRGARDSLIIGVDMSTQALQIAREEFANVRDAVVEFVQARAEDLSKVVKQKMDAVVFCNAIHLIPNKSEVLAEIGRTLKPGGLFAFNSTFYHGSMPPETDSYYRRWMMRAIRVLKTEQGMTPDRTKVMARQQLTPEQYRDLLAGEGFSIAREHTERVQVPLQGWLDICSFADFVEGALPGVPIPTASDILRRTVTQTFEEMGLTVVPRNWMEIVAVRA